MCAPYRCVRIDDRVAADRATRSGRNDLIASDKPATRLARRSKARNA